MGRGQTANAPLVRLRARPDPAGRDHHFSCKDSEKVLVMGLVR